MASTYVARVCCVQISMSLKNLLLHVVRVYGYSPFLGNLGVGNIDNTHAIAIANLPCMKFCLLQIMVSSFISVEEDFRILSQTLKYPNLTRVLMG